jgi:hypothetical protein
LSCGTNSTIPCPRPAAVYAADNPVINGFDVLAAILQSPFFGPQKDAIADQFATENQHERSGV